MSISTFPKSRFLVTAAVTTLLFCIGCSKDEKVSFDDTEYGYVTFVGSVIKPANEAAVNTWYNETHIPMLMQYTGLKKAYRFKDVTADALPPIHWTIYSYPTKTDMDNMYTSPHFGAALEDMSTQWPDSQIYSPVAISYQKLKSFEKSGAIIETANITVVGVELDPASDAAINTWYNETHIPMFMEYEGLVKAVRFKQLDDQENADALPTYMIVYYYSSKLAQEKNPEETSFQNAMADAEARWGDKLQIMCVMTGEKLFVKEQ